MNGEWVFTAATVGVALGIALTAVGAVMFAVQVIRDRQGPPDLPRASR